MKYTIATLNDLEEIILMKNIVKERILEKALPIWLNGYPMDEFLEEDIRHGYGRIIIENDEIVGYASLYPAQADYPPHTFSKEQLYSFGRVMVKYEGRHCASFLVRSMIEEVQKKNIEGMGILVDECNKAAVHLYEKYGFKKIGSKQFPYAYLDIYEFFFTK